MKCWRCGAVKYDTQLLCDVIPGTFICEECDGVFGQEGAKHDSEKVRMDLLSPLALHELSRVLTYGAQKYKDNNWRKGMSWSRLIGACLRHLFAFMRGEDVDAESNLPHLAHAMCCLMFLSEYQLTKNGTDDRWMKPNGT